MLFFWENSIRSGEERVFRFEYGIRIETRRKESFNYKPNHEAKKECVMFDSGTILNRISTEIR